MREINEFANGIRGILSKIVQSSEFKRAAEEISQPPRDHAADYSRQLNLEAEARDRIPRESLHRLSDIAESTRSTREGLESLREDLETFRRSQPPVFLQWAAIIIAAFGVIIALFEMLKK
jgi:hypothetical protein